MRVYWSHIPHCWKSHALAHLPDSKGDVKKRGRSLMFSTPPKGAGEHRGSHMSAHVLLNLILIKQVEEKR